MANYKDIQLSKNFTLHEFCNTKDGYAVKLPDISLVEKLQDLRDIVGEITITSGYRTPAFNKKCGGSKNSYHLKGMAVDAKFDFSDWTLEALLKLINGLGFGNVGFYYKDKRLDRLHLDIGKPWQSKKWTKYKDIAYRVYKI